MKYRVTFSPRCFRGMCSTALMTSESLADEGQVGEYPSNMARGDVTPRLGAERYGFQKGGMKRLSAPHKDGISLFEFRVPHRIVRANIGCCRIRIDIG